MVKKKKKIFYLISIGFLIFLFCFPSFSKINKVTLLQERWIPNIPTIHTSNQGVIDKSGQELFWFIQLTDTHIPLSSIASLNNLFGQTFTEIDPAFIINTGDLVDGNGLLNLYSPNEGQWQTYRSILDENNMNPSIYFDIIGNHDVSLLSPTDSYYLDYSMIGSEFGVTQYSFNKSYSFGKYAFICLDTTKDTTYFEFSDFTDFNTNGYLYPYELDWYEEQLENYKFFDKILVFGHNPFDSGIYDINRITDYETSDSKLTFDELNANYNIFCYICGHSHVNAVHKINGLFEIETTNFPSNGGTYRIIAMDKGHISTKLATIGTWPQYIVTYPPNNVFAPDDFNNEDNKIRVLAWNPDGIDLVEWSAYDINNNQITDWSKLKIVDSDGPLWEGEWNSILNDRNDFEIRVRISESGKPPDDPTDNSSDDKDNVVPNLGFIPIIVIGGILITVISVTGIIKHRSKSR